MATYTKFYKTFVDKKDELTKIVFANTPTAADKVVSVKHVGNETYAVTVEASTPEVLELDTATWPVVEKPYISLTLRQATASTPYEVTDDVKIADEDFVHKVFGAAFGLGNTEGGELTAEFVDGVPVVNKVGDTAKLKVALQVTKDNTEGFEDNKILFNGRPMLGELSDEDKTITIVVDVPVVKPNKQG